MEANKIILNGEVLIDLTGDTATEDKVLQGEVFHRADGTKSVGTLAPAAPVPFYDNKVEVV